MNAGFIYLRSTVDCAPAGGTMGRGEVAEGPVSSRANCSSQGLSCTALEFAEAPTAPSLARCRLGEYLYKQQSKRRAASLRAGQHRADGERRACATDYEGALES